MDLYIDTSVEELEKIFQSVGFDVRRGKDCHHALRPDGRGRLHAEFVSSDDRVYCDFHFDQPVHFLFLGVDYRKRPRRFFEDCLERLFEERRIRVEVHEVNWLSRRNRAVFRGFRL